MLQRYSDAIRVGGGGAKNARRGPAGLGRPRAGAISSATGRRSVASDLDLARRSAPQPSMAAALAPRDRVEFLIALGQSLYFDEAYSLDDRFSAAAEQFEVALATRRPARLEPSRDRLFEWWAGALDRQAQQGRECGAGARSTSAFSGAPKPNWRAMTSAASAAYWLAAAARGVDDLPRAMGAAVAGWVRAAALGARGDALRADLDRLMRQVILPERARELTPRRRRGDAGPSRVPVARAEGEVGK